MVDNSIIALSGILAKNEGLYYQAVESGGGEQKVCRVLDERDAKIRSEFDSERKILNEKIEQKDALLAVMGAELKRLKEEIEQLNLQIAEK